MRNKQKFLPVMLACVLALSACSYFPSWMGGDKKPEEKAKLPGERIDVLPANSDLKPDEAVQKTPFELPAVVENADWPQATGLFSAATANLAYPGKSEKIIKSSAGDGKEFNHTLLPIPVVGGGAVFAMDAAGHISAHDAADITKIRWHSKGVAEHDAPDSLGGGLAYDQGKLYAVSARGLIAAYDAVTGKVIWNKSMGVPFHSAPAVVGEKLYVTTLDNQTFAINSTNGDVIWSQRGINETADFMTSLSPLVADDKVIVPYSSGEFFALSTADGSELWKETLLPANKLATNAPFSGIGGNPIVDTQAVFATGTGGLIAAFGLANGQHVWNKPLSATNTPWLVGDYLYILTSDNILVCLLKYDGRVRWTAKLPDFKNEEKKEDPIVWKGPVVANGNLAIVGSRGELALVTADEGKLVAVKKIPENILTPPVIAGGRMYLVGQDATLYEIQ